MEEAMRRIGEREGSDGVIGAAATARPGKAPALAAAARKEDEGGSRLVRRHAGREGEEGEAPAGALVAAAACCGRSGTLSRRASKGAREESRR